MKIDNFIVAGIEEAVNSSRFAKQTEINKSIEEKDWEIANKLAKAKVGTGHNSFLKTIIMAMDITATKQWWLEWSRYSFSDIGSSQSTIHKLKDMNLDNIYIKYVDDIIIERMKVLQAKYNSNPTKENFYKLIYSNPCGIELTARVQSNYLQEKTIYFQRKNHPLEPEWGYYCKWLEKLPNNEWITGSDER